MYVYCCIGISNAKMPLVFRQTSNRLEKKRNNRSTITTFNFVLRFAMLLEFERTRLRVLVGKKLRFQKDHFGI